MSDKDLYDGWRAGVWLEKSYEFSIIIPHSGGFLGTYQ